LDSFGVKQPQGSDMTSHVDDIGLLFGLPNSFFITRSGTCRSSAYAGLSIRNPPTTPPPQLKSGIARRDVLLKERHISQLCDCLGAFSNFIQDHNLLATSPTGAPLRRLSFDDLLRLNLTILLN
jgi:hypothetical protein